MNYETTSIWNNLSSHIIPNVSITVRMFNSSVAEVIVIMSDFIFACQYILNCGAKSSLVG